MNAYWLIVLSLLFSNNMNAQQHLTAREQQIVTIASFTAKGNLSSLKNALVAGLDSGLTINEIKEVLVHLYAYTGFPRSLQGINTFLAVLSERKAKGITDKLGKAASPVTDSLSRYERGKKVLESLTGRKETGAKTGYAAFSPEIEVFLKEHLFADLFTRDILNYSDREIATIAALINLGGVEPMLQSHMRIALNIGINESKLSHLISIIENEIGWNEANSANKVLATITDKATAIKGNKDTSLFSLGVRAPAERFTGTVWVNMLVEQKEGFGHTAGTVTFEPGARTNWHRHPGGQVLLVISGKGYYQEKGVPVKIIYKGDVVKCPAGIEHWHGASPDTEMSHVAISSNMEKGAVVWGGKVTDEQYKSFR